jgi:hypothetical protein
MTITRKIKRAPVTVHCACKHCAGCFAVHNPAVHQIEWFCPHCGLSTPGQRVTKKNVKS